MRDLIFTDIAGGRFYNSDCFEAMAEMPDGCADMVLCDLPYGTTACKWDIVIPFDKLGERGIHPTQKPVALFEYLIKTYTNENDLVLDNCAGSGTTAVACKNLNRRWVCIEKDSGYYEKALGRL